MRTIKILVNRTRKSNPKSEETSKVSARPKISYVKLRLAFIQQKFFCYVSTRRRGLRTSEVYQKDQGSVRYSFDFVHSVMHQIGGNLL